MHREHQWCRDGREQEVRSFVVVPMAGRAAPPHCEKTASIKGDFVLGTVSQGCEVRNQTTAKTSADALKCYRKHIPQERT